MDAAAMGEKLSCIPLNKRLSVPQIRSESFEEESLGLAGKHANVNY
jgi:hypothetical protein